MSTDADDTACLRDALRRCRDELAAVREREEVLAENQAAGDMARQQLAALAQHVDTHLTRTELSQGGVRGALTRRLVRTVATPGERADTKELRRSRLFDGVWYLSSYPEVAETGLSPALHYLRHGAAEGKDPGPEFSTKHYVSRHPQVLRTGANPLLNHLRTGQ